MFGKLAAAAALGAGLLLALAGSASAYTLGASGVGWVGKGEVQSASGWNNKSMQDNVSGVTFAYDSTSTYEVVCEFDTPGGNHHVITNTKTTGLLATVAATPARTAAASRAP
ncbi:hypothetical protein [Pedococcus bigeumensis]|uniref:Uncharacterized protein n=1 Tax=Pedococcus bigeumensis TaxID=433644 RepID=A0A502CQ88_9MICO|nr:hypothetical protein [Pedococcus bigeumensis]TPG13861.1 hypothetical protein EAH86_16625 [Pedococcus bigeumensis]